jgi:AcrR family transcriptional regulator
MTAEVELAADPDGQDGRPHPRTALLDAAERLLVQAGYSAITTRRLGEEAGVNHGLIHYYFGSMEELLLQAFERFTDRLVKRQRELYAESGPFVDKWRTAMAYMDEDREAGYPRINAELRGMARNHPGLQERLRGVYEQWWEVLADALEPALRGSQLERAGLTVEAAVAFVFAYTLGTEEQRLVGFARGQDELRLVLDRVVASLENGAGQRDGEGR